MEPEQERRLLLELREYLSSRGVDPDDIPHVDQLLSKMKPGAVDLGNSEKHVSFLLRASDFAIFSHPPSVQVGGGPNFPQNLEAWRRVSTKVYGQLGLGPYDNQRASLLIPAFADFFGRALTKMAQLKCPPFLDE